MYTSNALNARPARPLWLTVPAGLALFTFFCDWMGNVAQGGESWQTIAYYPLVAGLAVAVAAAAPGFFDMLTLPNGIPRKTFIHMGFHFLVAGLYGAGLWLRLEDEMTPWTVVLSVVTASIVCLDAWRREIRLRRSQLAEKQGAQQQSSTKAQGALPIHA